ncbi:hypothetical protein B4N89_13845 [Embleya scabrispora]|uniref:Uncharacterized protein n=1 Tax=Embleya scabrispora TaxID=159449 RepID=A0A1T3NYF9_9ACTN|nr:hypothetical protein [Embleya scabrispora]OPC81873.1 hypothetical protein B4N89_13845 [Embleya scabrispora]
MSNYGDPGRVEAIAAELAGAAERVRPVSTAVDWSGGAAEAFAARAQVWRRECAATEPAVLAVVEALRAHAAAIRAALGRIAANERAAREAAGPTGSDAVERFPASGSAAWLDERWAAR